MLIKPSLFTSSRTKEAFQSARRRSLCDASLIHVPAIKARRNKRKWPRSRRCHSTLQSYSDGGTTFPITKWLISAETAENIASDVFFRYYGKKKKQLPVRDARISANTKSEPEPSVKPHNDLVGPASSLASFFHHRT